MQQFDQPFSGACGALQLSPYLRQCGDGACDENGIDQELRKLPRCHHIGAHVCRANPEDADNAGKDQKDDNRRHEGANDDPLARRLKRLLGQAAEPGAAGRLSGVSLNGLSGAQRLGRLGGAVCDTVLADAAELSDLAAQKKDWEDHQRHDQQREPGQFRAGPDHQRKAAKQHQDIAQSD